jgi:hypothetical protein
MVEITLFEFNIDAEDLIANAPFSSGGDEADESPGGGFFSKSDDDTGLLSTGDEDGDDDVGAGGDGGPPLKPIAVGAGLLVLVLAIVAGRRLLGGEPEPLP